MAFAHSSIIIQLRILQGSSLVQLQRGQCLPSVLVDGAPFRQTMKVTLGLCYMSKCPVRIVGSDLWRRGGMVKLLVGNDHYYLRKF